MLSAQTIGEINRLEEPSKHFISTVWVCLDCNCSIIDNTDPTITHQKKYVQAYTFLIRSPPLLTYETIAYDV